MEGLSEKVTSGQDEDGSLWPLGGSVQEAGAGLGVLQHADDWTARFCAGDRTLSRRSWWLPRALWQTSANTCDCA